MGSRSGKPRAGDRSEDRRGRGWRARRFSFSETRLGGAKSGRLHPKGDRRLEEDENVGCTVKYTAEGRIGNVTIDKQTVLTNGINSFLYAF